MHAYLYAGLYAANDGGDRQFSLVVRIRVAPSAESVAALGGVRSALLYLGDHRACIVAGRDSLRLPSRATEGSPPPPGADPQPISRCRSTSLNGGLECAADDAGAEQARRGKPPQRGERRS